MEWLVFNLFVLGMLALDLGVFHKKAHEIKFKEAVAWTGVWIVLALAFNGWIYYAKGSEKALQFLTGYLIEKSLSVDNIFVFITIFTCFSVPKIYQHKVLFWGIISALILRAIFIFVGVAAITKFHWVIYVFGFFLILTGIKLVLDHGKEFHPEKNPVLLLFKKMFPVTHEYHQDKFFVKQNAVWTATPLFVALIIVEVTDVLFAVDSIPAILAITQDSYIVYTSNVFAILGLRSLYFALAGFAGLFRYLHYGLSAVLVFVGTKMLIAEFYKVPVVISLTIVVGLITISIIVSLLAGPEKEKESRQVK